VLQGLPVGLLFSQFLRSKLRTKWYCF